MSKCTRCDGYFWDYRQIIMADDEPKFVYVCQEKSCPNYGNLTFASKE